MDAFATLITNMLDSLIPLGTSNYNDWVTFNESAGILGAYGALWKFIIKPIWSIMK